MENAFNQYIFSDASYAPQQKIGFVAHIILNKTFGHQCVHSLPISSRLFEQTTASALEIEACLWAFDEIKRLNPKNSRKLKISLFTDSQTLADLKQKQSRLELNQFCSKKTGLPLSNAALYRRFFSAIAENQAEIIKIKGHQPKSNRTPEDEIFSLVDQEARRKLRAHLASLTT